MTETPAFPDRDAWAADNCSMARALDVIGTRSALLLLREAFFGARRFDDFQRRAGVTAAVTAARLRDLVDAGLLGRHPYQESGQRTRQEYLLTSKGRDLFPVLVALVQWGDRYLSDPAGPPVRLWHDSCEAEVRVEVRCARDHAVTLQECRVGPAAGAARR